MHPGREPLTDYLLGPPDAAEVAITSRGVQSAVEHDGELTELQSLLIRQLFHSMTGVDVGPWEEGGITPYQLGSARAAAQVDGRAYRPWTPDPTRA